MEHLEPQELLEALDEQVAGVFVELLQGEGGLDMLTPEYCRTLRQRCSETGALLGVDEIQTGWGRCGALSLAQAWGMEPDILCFAKGVAGGLPAGITLWKKELGGFPPRGHGSTYGGNPLVAAVALEVLGLLEEELLEQLPEKEAFFRRVLENLSSPLIKSLRGKGLLQGVELTIPAGPVVKELQEEGVLSLVSGTHVVRFLPPSGGTGGILFSGGGNPGAGASAAGERLTDASGKPLCPGFGSSRRSSSVGRTDKNGRRGALPGGGPSHGLGGYQERKF